MPLDPAQPVAHRVGVAVQVLSCLDRGALEREECGEDFRSISRSSGLASGRPCSLVPRFTANIVRRCIYLRLYAAANGDRVPRALRTVPVSRPASTFEVGAAEEEPWRQAL
jgi:hypothetical protein